MYTADTIFLPWGLIDNLVFSKKEDRAIRKGSLTCVPLCRLLFILLVLLLLVVASLLLVHRRYFVSLCESTAVA